MRPHSQRLFNVILTRPDKSLRKDQIDEIEELAEEVRNALEHLHQGFRVLNDILDGRRYLFSQEDITYVDIIIFNEISQILYMAHKFRQTSRSELFKQLN